MAMDFSNRVGLESLQLAIYKTIHANINNYIEIEETHGATLDAEIASASGRDPVGVTLERFDARYIHYGHRPSMIEAPIEEYPSMSVMAYMASPSATNMNADYGHSFTVKCAIEMIVKSGPYPPDDRAGIGEDIVGRRLKRTTEAVHRLMDDNSSVGGLFMPPEMAPVITLGEIFEREEDGVAVLGSRWYWQGCRMEYTYLKQTVFGQD